MYVKEEGVLDENKFLSDVKNGKSFVTNGPIIGLDVEGKSPGDSITINAKGETISYRAFLRSNVAVDSFELVFNGEVVAHLPVNGDKKTADIKGGVFLKGPGWLLLRAWSPNADPNLMDIYPYSSTNPVYINVASQKLVSKSAAEYFLQWINRLETIANANTTYRNNEEKNAVMKDIEEAKIFYTNCLKNATVK